MTLVGFFLTFCFWTVHVFLPSPAQPLQISLSIACVILISVGRTPQCRCYSSPPPPVISGFNLTSFDLFTYVMWNVSGFLPSPCFPSCIHWMPSCCFIVVCSSGCCSSGRACLRSCSAVMNFLQFARSCLTFCRIITQIASGVCFTWNVWIKITGLVIRGEPGSAAAGLGFGKFP